MSSALGYRFEGTTAASCSILELGIIICICIMSRSMHILRVTEHIILRKRGTKIHHDRFTDEINWVHMPVDADQVT